MTALDLAALCYLCAIPLIVLAAVWQMYVVLNESHALNRFQNSKTMIWVAISLFFSFSLSLYWFCPHTRRKGWIFALMGGSGIILYGLAMWFKKQALMH